MSKYESFRSIEECKPHQLLCGKDYKNSIIRGDNMIASNKEELQSICSKDCDNYKKCLLFVLGRAEWIT